MRISCYEIRNGGIAKRSLVHRCKHSYLLQSAMDAQLIASLFQHTLDPSPETRAQAEARLQEVYIIT